MFDFGAPVGFRLAVRHPDRVAGLVIQNGNAYEAGLGPRTQPLRPYWSDRAAHEDGIRAGALSLEGTRTQYVEGTPDPTAVNPDLWELDHRYLDVAGHERTSRPSAHTPTSPTCPTPNCTCLTPGISRRQPTATRSPS